MKYILFVMFTLFACTISKAQMPAGFKDFEVAPGLAGSSPTYMVEFGGKLYFYGSDGSSGREPFYAQGAGTAQLIRNMNPGSKHSISTNYNMPATGMNGNYYFTAENGSSGEEMYMYDGTNIPSLVFDPTFGPDSSKPDNYLVHNGKLYFSATTAADGYEMYAYDGTNPPARITDINTGSANSVFGPFASFSNKIFFVGNTTQYGSELWSYNPVTGTAAIEADIDTGMSSSNPANFTIINGILYFSATTFSFGRELYKYDGSNPPQRLSDINPGSFSSLSAVHSNAFTPFNNKIYFGARDSSGESHLWFYNPANGNILLDHKLNPSGDASPREFVVYNGRLFFTADDGVNGFELFVYDGSSTPAIVADLCFGPNGSFPSELISIGDELYFSANNCNSSGVDLFSYNYKRAGIRNVLFDADVNVYPNPVQQNLTIEIQLKKEEQLRIRLADVTGKTIYDGSLLPFRAGKNKTEIPMQNLPAGNYIYYITDANGTTCETGKLVKQ